MKYRSIHSWIVYNFGKADLCEECGLTEEKENKKRTFCWSNLSGEYKKERSDWRKLCYSCHKRYDVKRLELIPWNKGLKGLQKWHNISGLNTRIPWNKGKRGYKEIKCVCGKVFYPPKKTSKFCSKSCATKSRYIKPKDTTNA